MPQKTVTDVMQDVFEGSKFKCLPYEKRNLDEDPYSEYGEYDYRIRGRMFENPETNTISTVPTTGVDETVPSILTYFMDGSRRVFRFSDVILPDGRYYPVLAGQVTAGQTAAVGTNTLPLAEPEPIVCTNGHRQMHRA